MTDYSKALIRGTGIVFASTAGTSVIGYLLKLVLARNLTITEFGLVFSIISLFGVFLILPGIGAGKALVRYVTEHRTRQEKKEIKTTILTSFFLNLLFSTIIGSLFIIFSKEIAINYIHDISAAFYIKIYAIAFILTPTIGTFKSIFIGFRKNKYYAIVDFSKMLVILVLAFIFLKLGYGITGVMLAYTLVYILPLLIYYPLFKKRVFPEFSKIKAGIKLETAKKLLKFGIPLTIAGTASIIFGYMDTVIITFFRSLEEVALYNVGLPTIRLMWNFERALTVVLLPIAIELWVQKDKERFNRGINNIYKYILTLTIPFIIIMLVFPELILKVLFGPDYVGAATVVRILAVASIIIVLARINVALITGIGKPSIISKIMIIGALINLAVNLILIPLIGINGAAISTAAAFSVILVYTHKKLKEKTQIKLPFKTILKILMAGIITIPIIYILKSVINTNVYLEAIIVVAISLGIYYMLIVNFGVIKLKEVKKLISKLKPTSKTP